MTEFNTDQQMAYDAANLEQRTRGMPDHTAAEFMAMRPLMFPGLAPGSLTCKPTPLPPEPLGSRRSNAAKAREAAAAKAAMPE